MKVKSLIGFKVCIRVDGKYESVATMRIRGGVEYKIGKRSVPVKGCGPLTIFKTEEEAMRCIDGKSSYYLFRCRYQPSRGKYIWFLGERKLCPSYFDEVCRANGIDPKHAALARSITPIEEIQG